MLTARGWSVFGAGLAALTGSWLLGYPELAVLGVGCLAMVALSALWLIRTPDLVVHREIAPPKVARHGRAVGLITVTARRRTAASEATDRCGTEAFVAELPALAVGIAHTTTRFLPTRRRGEVGFGPLSVAGTDPMRLVHRKRSYGTVSTLLVRPATVPLDGLPQGRAVHAEGAASHSTAAGAATFHGLREYVPGDDLRRVHWRTSARAGTLMVRQSFDALLPGTTLVLDARPLSYPDDEAFELAVEIAASIGKATAGPGFPVAVWTTQGLCHTVAAGQSDVDGLLDRLALLQASPVGSLAAVLGNAGPGGALVVVGGTIVESELSRVTLARPRFDHALTVSTVDSALPGVLFAPDLSSFAQSWKAAWR